MIVCGVICKRTGRPCRRPAVNGGPCLWHDPERKPQRFWTPARLFKLAEYIERGWTDDRIAAEFGTTVNGVQLARKRHGLASRTKALMCSRAVADEIGVACSKSIVRWIERGWLRGRRGQPRGGNRQWYVRREDFVSFLDDPRYWHLWNPARIPDPATRTHYTEARQERYLTTGQVAERCYVTHRAVQQWIRKGQIPAVKYGNWLIRESDLVGFVVPSQRSKRGRPVRVTPERDTLLLRLREQGWKWREVGDALGISEKAARARGRYLRRLEAEMAA